MKKNIKMPYYSADQVLKMLEEVVKDERGGQGDGVLQVDQWFNRVRQTRKPTKLTRNVKVIATYNHPKRGKLNVLSYKPNYWMDKDKGTITTPDGYYRDIPKADLKFL